MSVPFDLLHQIRTHKFSAPRRVFSVFCIGSNHNQKEINNTMAALGHACVSPDGNADPASYKYINDGPGGEDHVSKARKLFNGAVGWGMNNFLANTFQAIVAADPTVVNLTGHSRGAILCHMIAHKLYANPATRHIKINMIVLDPVHQSKIRHDGSEHLDDNPNLLSYHSIIMEHESALRGKAFPFKFVRSPDQIAERSHYINMPGTHGSGTQQLTSPVGRLTYELIANFMRARGTMFSHPVPTPLDMCEHFAQVHVLNPLVKNAKSGEMERVVFNDDGADRYHNQINDTIVKSTKHRRGAVTKALGLNQLTVQQPHLRVLPTKPIGIEYFFNQEHAFYFKMAFPYMYGVLSKAPNRSPLDVAQFARERQKMQSLPGLNGAKPLLLEQISQLWMN